MFEPQRSQAFIILFKSKYIMANWDFHEAYSELDVSKQKFCEGKLLKSACQKGRKRCSTWPKESN
jgi:hypothetical protein